MKDTSVYAGIVKMDDNGDGTLTVYGKATDDSIDIDQQICDPAWLDQHSRTTQQHCCWCRTRI
jgi:hypothetical protein